ncbi:MAG: methyl-accepting chemotaxis protein, partial [Gammaproteobacteria bacterium]
MKLLKTIKGKLISLFVVIISFILVAFGYYNYIDLEKNLRKDLSNQVASLKKRLQQSLPDPVWNYSDNAISQIIESEMGSSFVAGIYLWRADGSLADAMNRNEEWKATKVDKNGPNKNPKTDPKLEEYGEPESIKLIYQNGAEMNQVGEVQVYVSTRELQEMLRNSAIKQGIQVILVDLVLVVAQLLIISRVVDNPLSGIMNAFKEIAQGGGDLRQRLKVNSQDELGELSVSFNTFLNNLQIMVSDIIVCAQDLTNSSNEAAGLTAKTKEELERQRAEISSLATAVNEMAASAQQVAQNAEQAATSTKHAYEESSNGKDVVDKTV